MSNRDVSAAIGLLAETLRTLGRSEVRADESLARYTALRIGGPADLLVRTESVDSLRQAVSLSWEAGLPCQVLGSATNVLVSDAGIRGLVILNRARRVHFAETVVHAESGASLSTLARQSINRGLTGLEWAIGIPGTVGGAVVGNAGAWGGDIASSLTQARVLERDGETGVWPVENLQYGYRTSILKQPMLDGLMGNVVLEAEFAVQRGERGALEEKVTRIVSRRKASQPPGATCGSVFRNPAGDHAGRLIETAGLKGKRCGGMEISPVHANFFVNRGHASASDMRCLIDLARSTVLAQYGITLELEIQLIGDWTERTLGMDQSDG
ncbi:UDP-N-acetylmuramate dehydrogenase [Chloroflexota bacterium]